ncbi:type II secretion system F family protein [Geosporobacter ferrireducens]|uniref:type II secretion system F family protein n=1 Tax=Geosporobacter ferrireducens TaxID=1424294 RepID=UPI00139E711F|nr:hypothetical protein [Geosporobacter ferrireducens]MTI53793.1 hypothetical protein [Geosporobacter ferrireducens]
MLIFSMLKDLDRMRILGIAMMMISGCMILINLIRSIKQNTQIRGEVLVLKNEFYEKVDRGISKIKVLDGLKEELQLKYGVINGNTENKNRIAAVKTIFFLSILSLLCIVVFAYVIKIWYLVVPVAIGMLFFPYGVLFSLLHMKMSVLKDQFPDAVNVFITKYPAEKNKDKALQKTYVELENPMRFQFMRLARDLANKTDVEKAVYRFCKRINYIWTDIFGELLIMNHHSVGDIGPELNEFSLLMLEDQVMEAQQRAEISATKTVNFLVAAFVGIVVLINIAIFKAEAMNIYFQQYAGIASISIAVLTIIICLSLTFYFEKS